MNIIRKATILMAMAVASFALSAGTGAPGIFAKKVTYTFAYEGATSGVSDVPVLVKLSEDSPVGFSYADCPDGSDIRFADADGSTIPHEIDTWDATGISLIWVKAPAVTKDTTFTMYYKGTPEGANVPSDVWSGYTGVWHLNDADAAASTYGSYPNSTATNGINGRITKMSAEATATDASGQIGKGCYISSAGAKSGDYNYGGIEVPHSSDLGIGSEFTVSGWFKHKNQNYHYDHMFYKRQKSDNTLSPNKAFAIEWNNSSTAATIAPYGSSATKTSITVTTVKNSWGYFTFVYSGTTCTLYQNGVKIKAGSITKVTDNEAPFTIGNNCNCYGTDGAGLGSCAWCGWVDEVRLAGGKALTADEVAAEYAAMTGDSFVTAGAVEDIVEPGTPAIDEVSVVPAATAAVFSGSVVSLGTGSTACDIYVKCASSTDEGEATLVVKNHGVGDFTFTLEDLTPETAYSYEVYAVNTSTKESPRKKGAFTTKELPTPPVLGAVSVLPLVAKGKLSGMLETLGGGATACDISLAVASSGEELGTPERILTLTAPGAFSYTIQGLGLGKAYAYRLVASNDSSDETVTVEGTFTTRDGAVIEPTGDPNEDTGKVQDEIDAAANDDEPATVTLGEGTFVINAQLAITGGVTVVGQGWEKTVILQTGSGQRVANVAGGATLRGVTLTGGQIRSSWTHGAGALVEGGTISWCCISNNATGLAGNFSYGGGVSISSGTIDHSIIAFNTSYAKTGGSSYGGGLGLYRPSGDVLVDSCLICGNDAPSGGGGGIYAEFGTSHHLLTVRHTTIANNTSSSAGGGVGVSQSVAAKYDFALIDSIIADNTAKSGDLNMALPSDEGVLAGYAAQSFANLLGSGTTPLGEGSKNGAAHFRDAALGDYHLNANSDAIGLGQKYEGMTEDLDGLDRADKPSAGCYEYDPDSDPFSCLVDTFQSEAFTDETVSLSATTVNPPEGAELTFAWSFVNQFDHEETATGNPVSVSGYQPGVYSVTVTATDTVSGRSTLPFTAETPLHIAVRTNYVTAVENPDAAYPYDTPEKAASNVNEAIACAISGSTVILDAGRHRISSCVEVTKGLRLYGQGAESTTITPATASGDIVLLRVNHSSAIVQGITFAGGRAGGQAWTIGAGVVYGSNGGTVRNCTVRDCRSPLPTAGNSWATGIAVYMDAEEAVMENCTVTCNTNGANSSSMSIEARYGFGGIVYLGKGSVRNLLVKENVCTGVSPIAYVSGTMQNCTFVKNEMRGSAAYTAAVYAENGRLENSIFWGNTANNNVNPDSETLGKPNWALSGSAAGQNVRYCCWADSIPLGESALDASALKFKDAAADNYRLDSRCALRNKGLNDEDWMRTGTDFDGKPRIIGRAVDPGCYELNPIGLLLMLR